LGSPVDDDAADDDVLDEQQQLTSKVGKCVNIDFRFPLLLHDLKQSAARNKGAAEIHTKL